MSEYAAWIDAGSTGAEALGKVYNKFFTPGSATVLNATSHQVTQRGAGANMSVDIAAGAGISDLADYSIPVWSSAIVNKVVTAADPTNPRKDIVVRYVDLTAFGSSNNQSALKFIIVAGTAAGSPTDPSDPTIQSAVGAGNPWEKLARITLPATAPSVVNAYITDLRTPVAFAGTLWGGSSNTVGHSVPNVADDTVALLAAAQNLTNKSLDSTNTLTAPKFRSIDGWVDANESWTFATSTTITVPTDATTKYDVGDYVKMTQSATVKYFQVTGVAATVLTVAGFQGVTVANSAITANFYSKTRNPHGIGTGPMQSATVSTLETTASTSYTDLATTTDTVTVTIGQSGSCLVILTCDHYNATNGQFDFISFAASGANTISASDSNAIINKNAQGSDEKAGSWVKGLTGLTPGSTTFKMKYKVNANTGNFQNRTITVVPL